MKSIMDVKTDGTAWRFRTPSFETARFGKPAGVSLTILAACCFGMLPLFAKMAYNGGFNAYSFSLLRVFFTAIALFFILRMKNRAIRISRAQALSLFKASFFGYFLMMVTLCVAYTYMATGLATSLHFIYPVATMAGAVLIYREKTHAVQLGALAISIAGIYLMVGVGSDGTFSLLGSFLALISGFFYAYYILTVSHGCVESLGSLVIIFYITLFNTLTLFVTCLILGKLPVDITAMGLLGTILVALVSSVIGMVAFQAGLKQISATSATILSTFEVITSLIIGVTLLSETLSVFQVGGSIMIIISVIAVALSEERAA